MILSILLTLFLVTFILGVLIGSRYCCEIIAHIFYNSNLIDYEKFEHMRSWKYLFEIFSNHDT